MSPLINPPIHPYVGVSPQIINLQTELTIIELSQLGQDLFDF